MEGKKKIQGERWKDKKKRPRERGEENKNMEVGDKKWRDKEIEIRENQWRELETGKQKTRDKKVLDRERDKTVEERKYTVEGKRQGRRKRWDLKCT